MNRTQVSYSSTSQQYYQQHQQQHHFHSSVAVSSVQQGFHEQQLQQQLHQQLQQQQLQQQQLQQQQLQQQQHFTPYANISEALEQRKFSHPRPPQQPQQPQQHGGEPQRLQPRTSSNRSLGMDRPVPPPHQPHPPPPPPHQHNVFYPVRVEKDEAAQQQLRSSIRGASGTGPVAAAAAAADASAGGLNKSSNVMTDSTSSVLSGSSVSSAMISWQHVQPGDWNIEQVGSWLRSIGSYPS